MPNGSLRRDVLATFLKLTKNPLRRLGTQIQLACGILRHTLKGLEHQVELADIRKIMAAAVRTCNIVFLDIGSKLVVAPSAGVDIQAVLRSIVLDKLIRAVTRLAGLAVHERIGKSPKMARRDPNLGFMRIALSRPTLYLDS